MNKRTRSAVATATVLSLLVSLSSCATKEQTGELVGTGVGVAVGAAFGEGTGKVAAMLVGGLVGSVVGKLIGKRLDEADRIKANNAAQQAASLPQRGRVDWTSDKNSNVHGYAEPVVASPSAGTVDTKFCFDPRYKVAYEALNGNCAGKDYYISEADFRQRASVTAPVSAVPPMPVAAPPPVVQTSAPSTACRRVHEVVIIDGDETKTDNEYCLRGAQWTRA